MTNTARIFRLTCCALVMIAGVTAQADAKKKKTPVTAAPAATTTVDPAVAAGRDRPGVATFQALPKLPPVSDVSDAAQTGGTSAANQAQIKRQQAWEAAEQARQAKVAADKSAYEAQETAYRQRMEAWNKQVAACKAGDVSQCAATSTTPTQ